MMRYLSLALLASSVLGAGCCCPGKCKFDCLSNRCKDGKSCAAHTSAKPVEGTAATPVKQTAPKKSPASTNSSRPEDIANAISSQPDPEPADDKAQDAKVAELPPPAAPVVPVNHQENAEAQSEAKVIEAEGSTSDGDQSSLVVPPPPPVKMVLAGVGAEKSTSESTATKSAEPKATEEAKEVAAVSAEKTENAVEKPTAEPLPPPASPEASKAVASSDEPASAGTAVAEDSTEYGHHKDYMWVQGKLIRIYARGGYWQIRYASYDENDEYGGKFVIVGSVGEDLREGDVVRIRGKVLGENRWLNGTEYRADTMQLVQRGTAPFAN
ncbi:MAG: hypothetical protein U1D30_13005 [Planctomycetota bacterium]